MNNELGRAWSHALRDQEYHDALVEAMSNRHPWFKREWAKLDHVIALASGVKTRAR